LSPWTSRGELPHAGDEAKVKAVDDKGSLDCQGKGPCHQEQADGCCIFDNKELIYTNYVPRSKKVNTDYIVDALSWFLEIFKKGP
jgi:hypothetical protein